MGVPIKSSLDVVQIGTTEDQIPVYVDKLASVADHIVLINHKHFTAIHFFRVNAPVTRRPPESG
jgi:hypothetical protein